LLEFSTKGLLMSRKSKIEKIGFYHMLNRGVARANVYLCDDDF